MGLIIGPIFAGPECTEPAAKILLSKAGLGHFEIRGGSKALPTLFYESMPPERESRAVALAYHYTVNFTHHGAPAELRLVVPVDWDGHPDNVLLNKILPVLKASPSVALKQLDFLFISPFPFRHQELFRKKYRIPEGKKFEVYGASNADTSGKNHIHLFPKAINAAGPFLLNTFRHELGHTMALAYYGKATPNSRWLEAMKNDGVPVSAYGRSSSAEDFAEAAMVYFTTEGGLNVPKVRRRFIHRFFILDEILEVDRALLPRLSL